MDFGGAEDAISKLVDVEEFGADIEYLCDSQSLAQRRRSFVYPKATASAQTVVSASIRYLPQSASRHTYKFELTFFRNTISIEIQDTAVSKLTINGTDFSSEIQGNLFARTWTSCFPNLVYKDGVAHDSESFLKLIYSFARTYTHGKSQTDRVNRLTLSLLSSPLDDMLKSIKSPIGGDSIWQRTTCHWHERSAPYLLLRNWILGARITEIFQAAAASFASHCMRVRYITPIRASAERYYRRQGLALGEIDPQGQNVAMYIHNMSSPEKQRFSLWMQEFFGYNVDTVATQGHISMVIQDLSSEQSEQSFNLADTGFGFSQMIPILIQLWSMSNQRLSPRSTTRRPLVSVITIEQPELHLHPKLQSRLADLLLQTIEMGLRSGVDLRLVVETHSEQIINRIGKRVATGEAKRDNVSVVLFQKPSFSDTTEVVSTTYDEEGLIDNWPYGFFESDD